MVKETRKRNTGSAVVEASVVLPLFLLFMLFVIYLYRMIYVDAHIHQSLCEAAVYCAKRCYLEDRLMQKNKNSFGEADQNNLPQEEKQAITNGLSESELVVSTGVVYTQFNRYMGDDAAVKQVVAGGKKGIIITVTADENDKKVFIAKADYITKLKIPIFGSFMFKRSAVVKQKAFLGFGSEDTINDGEEYVYITPNESVYHLSRSCTHLTRSVRSITGHKGYESCSFCGKDGKGSQVYVTDNGEVFHYNLNCLGLKRTVIRVKKRDVAGLKVCSRCGR